jgi:hypothetical protein
MNPNVHLGVLKKKKKKVLQCIHAVLNVSMQYSKANGQEPEVMPRTSTAIRSSKGARQ